MHSRWIDAGRAFASGDYTEAAARFAAIGSKPEEAFAHLRAAESLLERGERTAANAALGRALAFYRAVGATRFVRRGEALLAASA